MHKIIENEVTSEWKNMGEPELLGGISFRLRGVFRVEKLEVFECPVESYHILADKDAIKLETADDDSENLGHETDQVEQIQGTVLIMPVVCINVVSKLDKGEGHSLEKTVSDIDDLEEEHEIGLFRIERKIG